MVESQGKKGEQKDMNLYLVSVIGIVAIVAILSLSLTIGNNPRSLTTEEENVIGFSSYYTHRTESDTDLAPPYPGITDGETNTPGRPSHDDCERCTRGTAGCNTYQDNLGNSYWCKN